MVRMAARYGHFTLNDLRGGDGEYQQCPNSAGVLGIFPGIGTGFREEAS
jgi:hypothetical protein